MEVTGQAGQMVAPGQPVVRLARDGEREAEIFVPEGRQAQAETAATANLFAEPDRIYPARLREMSAVADPATRTYRARYVLEGGGAAPLGSTVSISWDAGMRGETRFAIPLGAIVDNGNCITVWKLDPDTNRVSAQPITLARLGTESVDVASGLSPGDRIVALGAHLLKSGQQVRIGPKRVASALR